MSDRERCRLLVFTETNDDEIAFWERVFVAVCSANDCKEVESAHAWASLEARRRAFPTRGPSR